VRAAIRQEAIDRRDRTGPVDPVHADAAQDDAVSRQRPRATDRYHPTHTQPASRFGDPRPRAQSFRSGGLTLV
jgi:hypothetical protein